MDIPHSGAIFTLGKSYLAENTHSYFYIKNDPIKRLISGPNQSAVICESGRLFVWGENHYGQLGIGGNNNHNNNNNNNNSANNNSNNNNNNNNNVVTKPTCVKSLKTLGLKIANIAFGNDWAVILTYSNELFFTGRNIFAEGTNVAKNFTEATVDGDSCGIIRKPFRLDEFDDCLSKSEDTENFISVLAGNEHFAVMTSFGRLIGWGSNQNFQLGTSSEQTKQKPYEIILDSPVQQFTCGPESTLVLTENGTLYLTGHLNEFVFSKFTELQKNLSPTEQIIFMHISKTNEIYIVTNAGSIYRSIESLRTKSLIFQRFYDYDSEENGPIWKLLKGFSFYTVLTKAHKFYTTFSESGHHLKTFREISKFKNLRLLDMAVGDQHILVHGIPRSSTLSATIGPGGEHRFMSRTYVMPTVDMSAESRSRSKSNEMREDVKSANENSMTTSQMARQETPKTNTPIHNNNNNSRSEGSGILTAPHISQNHNANGNVHEPASTKVDEYIVKSPTESMASRKSARSIKFEAAALQNGSTKEKSLRPRTPYPEDINGNTPLAALKKTPLRNFSYEAAMEDDFIELTSPALADSLENIPEGMNGENGKALVTATVNSPTPPSEEDEQLTVEINTTTDPLDRTVVVNEIRFINNGIDVTANVKKKSLESEDDVTHGILYEPTIDDELAKETDIKDEINATTQEMQKRVESKIDEAQQSVESEIEKVKGARNEMLQQVEKAAGQTSLNLQHLQTTLKSNINDVKDTGSRMQDEVKESIDRTEANIGAAFQDAQTAVASKVGNVKESTEKLGNEMKTNLEEARTSLESNAEEIVKSTEKAGDKMESKLDEVRASMENTAKKAVAGAKDAVDSVGDNAKKMATGAKEAVNSVGENAKWIATGAKEAVDSVGENAKIMATGAKEAVESVGENVKVMATGAKEAVESVGENVKGLATGAKEAVESVGENAKIMATGAKEAAETAGENAKRMANDARHAVGNVGSNAFHAVENALFKVADSTKMAVDTVASKLTNDTRTTDDDDISSEGFAKNAVGGIKNHNITVLEDDERTTASVNSNHTTGGNPFENTNPFDNEMDDDDIVERRDKRELRRELSLVEPQTRHTAEHGKGKVRQFLSDIRSKGISCQNEKSIHIDDEPPRYTVQDELAAQRHNANGNQNTSKVCSIL